ncbi:MAG: gamma-glutamyltransferase, partial [Gammaproteobacteria bacterium]
MAPDRSAVMGTKHIAAAGHFLAAHAGFEILEAGGNAVDAGVSAGIAIGVLEPHMVNFAGVAPIMIYLAETGEILTISGLGTWPRAASCQYFHDKHGGAIPEGVERTVIPSAPDAWITALEQYGTMSFAEVAAAAIRFAKEGFPVYPLMTEILDAAAPALQKWPSSAGVLLPGDRVPEPGEIFVQSDLARTLQYLADEESTAAKKGRRVGLGAARDAFYRGDIARTIDRFFHENGGLMTAEDMAGFRVGIEPPVRAQFGNIDVYACGPWCQGPMLLQTLNLLQMFDLHGLGHNSPEYIHTLVEAINLAAADREHYYGDPRFVDVPMEELLSKEHANRRRDLIRPDRAGTEIQLPNYVLNSPKWVGNRALAPLANDYEGVLDTSYVCVVD